MLSQQPFWCIYGPNEETVAGGGFALLNFTV